MIRFCVQCWAENPPEAAVCQKCRARLESGGDYVERLISALRHPLPDTVQIAAYVLGERRESKAVPALIELLERSKEPGALEAAVEALGKIGERSAVQALTECIPRWPLRVRVKAAEALGRIGGTKAREQLRCMLQDSNAPVREAAQAALEAVRSGSQEVRYGLP